MHRLHASLLDVERRVVGLALHELPRRNAALLLLAQLVHERRIVLLVRHIPLPLLALAELQWNVRCIIGM